MCRPRRKYEKTSDLPIQRPVYLTCFIRRILVAWITTRTTNNVTVSLLQFDELFSIETRPVGARRTSHYSH